MTRTEPEEVVLAVVGPRGDCTPDDCRAIGAALRAWLSGHGYTPRVYGLDDLEAGRFPSSPAAYVIPFQDLFPDRVRVERWPVALATVAAGTDLDTAAADLTAGLGGVRDRLAYLTDPDTYDAYTR